MNEWITKSQRPNKCEHAILFLIFPFCLDAQMKWNAFCRITITMSMLFNAFVLRLFLLLIMNGYGVFLYSFTLRRAFYCRLLFFGNFLMSTISSEVKWNEMKAWRKEKNRRLAHDAHKPQTHTQRFVRKRKRRHGAQKFLCWRIQHIQWKKNIYGQLFVELSLARVHIEKLVFLFLLHSSTHAHSVVFFPLK